MGLVMTAYGHDPRCVERKIIKPVEKSLFLCDINNDIDNKIIKWKLLSFRRSQYDHHWRKIQQKENNSFYISNSVTSLKVFFCFIYFIFFTNKLTKQHIHSQSNLISFFQFFHFFPLSWAFVCSRVWDSGSFSLLMCLFFEVTAWKIPSRRGPNNRYARMHNRKTSYQQDLPEHFKDKSIAFNIHRPD